MSTRSKSAAIGYNFATTYNYDIGWHP
jgi:hypothetical protein